MKVDWLRYMDVPWVQYGRSVQGADCMGWVQLVVGDALDGLPEAQGLDSAPSDESTERLVGWIAAESSPWHEVEEAAEGDVLFFRIMGKLHCGVAISEREFVHIRGKTGPCRERFDRGVWRRQLRGIYRYDPAGAA